MNMLDRKHAVAHGHTTKGRQSGRAWLIRLDSLRPGFPAGLDFRLT